MKSIKRTLWDFLSRNIYIIWVLSVLVLLFFYSTFRDRPGMTIKFPFGVVTINVLFLIGIVVLFIIVFTKWFFDYLEIDRKDEPLKEDKLGFNVVTKLEQEDLKKVITAIRAEAKDYFIQDLLDEIEKKFSSNILIESKIKEIQGHFSSSHRRLSRETERLDKKGKLNLYLGCVIATIGMILLSYMVFYPGASGESESFLNSFLPRLTLVIFVELFAYFFLRLYSECLSDIKVFQNEITNIESKFLALKSAVIFEKSETLEEILLTLSQTERNFVLEKDQSTVELERTRLENNLAQNVVSALRNVLPGGNVQTKAGRD